MEKEEVSISIKQRWQMTLWKLSLIVASVVVAGELIQFLVYIKKKVRALSYDAYLLRYLGIPAVIYIIALLAVLYILNNQAKEEERNDWIVSFLMFLVFAVPAFTHSQIMAMILLCALAIPTTAIFANNDITFVITVLDLCVICINNIRVIRATSWTGYSYVGNFVMSMLAAVVLCVVTIIVNTHTNQLLLSISGSDIKEKNLMSELKKDPLTGLFNRRSFEESLDTEMKECEENGTKAYIAIFDIDHFKNVNDTYGHSNGDVVIQALCKMIYEKSKECGMAFRYGGEEFVILFSDIELAKVINIVEDIRTEFRCYYFQFMHKDGITCSCGIAQYTAGESARAWFNRADKSLYSAKEAGRNRTVVSE